MWIIKQTKQKQIEFSGNEWQTTKQGRKKSLKVTNQCFHHKCFSCQSCSNSGTWIGEQISLLQMQTREMISFLFFGGGYSNEFTFLFFVKSWIEQYIKEKTYIKLIIASIQWPLLPDIITYFTELLQELNDLIYIEYLPP